MNLYLILFSYPVEVIVELNTFLFSDSFNESLKKSIVRSIIEFKVPGVVEEDLNFL